MPKFTLLQGDALAVLKTLPSDSVHCCVTSPPYYGLRDYGTAKWEGGDAGCDHKQGRNGAGRADGVVDERGQRNRDGVGSMGGDCAKCGARRIDQQIGLEPTLDAYLSRLVAVFGEVRRVLHPSGVCFVNMGDSYCSQGGERTYGSSDGETGRGDAAGPRLNGAGLKPKDRLLVPFRLALLLQADGWWLRDIICWAKRAPMPESVTDRCTQSWEPIFMLTKAARYFWDAEAVKEQSEMTPQNRATNGRGGKDVGFAAHRVPPGVTECNSRNLRNVWLLSPSPYPDAHFATFVPEIPKRCILAGTSAKGVCPKCGEPWVRRVEPTGEYAAALEKPTWTSGGLEKGHAKPAGYDRISKETRTLGWSPGCACDAGPPIPATVLDPFAGTFTTGAVALDLGRHAIGIELSAEYVKLAERRCAAVTPGLALA